MRMKLPKALRGFTLIELIVVLVILGILAVLAVPTFNTIRNASSENVAQSTAAGIASNASGLLALNNKAAYGATEALEQASYEAGLADAAGAAIAGHDPLFAPGATAGSAEIIVSQGTDNQGQAAICYNAVIEGFVVTEQQVGDAGAVTPTLANVLASDACTL